MLDGTEDGKLIIVVPDKQTFRLRELYHENQHKDFEKNSSNR